MEYPASTESARVRVLQGIDLEVQAGESIAIVGPSGCGKSTLLNLMGTLDHPTRGQVLLDGEDLATLDAGRLAQVRNRRLGFVFQAHHLLPQCTVLENVLIPTLAAKENSVRENAKDDYEFVRKNLKQIIETNIKAMERLTKLASESESPRTFEVMSAYMKQMVEANESLMNLHKEVKDITDQPDGDVSEGGSSETNNYFVGSTEELLDILEARDQRKELGTVIEGEKTDND